MFSLSLLFCFSYNFAVLTSVSSFIYAIIIALKDIIIIITIRYTSWFDWKSPTLIFCFTNDKLLSCFKISFTIIKNKCSYNFIQQELDRHFVYIYKFNLHCKLTKKIHNSVITESSRVSSASSYTLRSTVLNNKFKEQNSINQSFAISNLALIVNCLYYSCVDSPTHSSQWTSDIVIICNW